MLNETRQTLSKKKDVELRVQRLTPDKIGRIFNNRTPNKNIITLLITTKNDSKEPVIFKQENTTLKLLSTQELASILSSSIFGKVLLGAFAIPLFFLATFTGLGAIGVGAIVPMGCCTSAYTAISLGGLGWFYLIGVPVIVGTTGYSIKNATEFDTNLSHDINKKILLAQTTAPGTEESALAFAKNLPEQFTITLLKGQEPVPFVVKLKKLEEPSNRHTKPHRKA
jgi:hypothetical protein